MLPIHTHTLSFFLLTLIIIVAFRNFYYRNAILYYFYDFADSGATPLMISVMHRKQAVCALLLQSGSNIAAATERSGRCSLHFAATVSFNRSRKNYKNNNANKKHH